MAEKVRSLLNRCAAVVPGRIRLSVATGWRDERAAEFGGRACLLIIAFSSRLGIYRFPRESFRTEIFPLSVLRRSVDTEMPNACAAWTTEYSCALCACSCCTLASAERRNLLVPPAVRAVLIRPAASQRRRVLMEMPRILAASPIETVERLAVIWADYIYYRYMDKICQVYGQDLSLPGISYHIDRMCNGDWPILGY